MKNIIVGSGLLLCASFAQPALAQHAKHPAPPASPLSTASLEAATVSKHSMLRWSGAIPPALPICWRAMR